MGCWWALKLLQPEQPVQTQTAIMRRSTHKLKIYFSVPLLSTPFWACYRNNQKMNCSLSTDHHLMEDFLLFPVCQLISVSQELIYVPRSRLPKNISYIFKHVSLKKSKICLKHSWRANKRLCPWCWKGWACSVLHYKDKCLVRFLNLVIKSWLNVNCFKLYKNN